MRSAVVVGAGIGGLGAAIAPHRAGWQVRVLERAREFGPHRRGDHAVAERGPGAGRPRCDGAGPGSDRARRDPEPLRAVAVPAGLVAAGAARRRAARRVDPRPAAPVAARCAPGRHRRARGPGHRGARGRPGRRGRRARQRAARPALAQPARPGVQRVHDLAGPRTVPEHRCAGLVEQLGWRPRVRHRAAGRRSGVLVRARAGGAARRRRARDAAQPGAGRRDGARGRREGRRHVSRTSGPSAARGPRWRASPRAPGHRGCG